MPYFLGVIIMVLLHNLLAAEGAGEQHMERRTSVRAALANKLDPNFWPSRGRRSETNTIKIPSKIFSNSVDSNKRRQTSDEDGPFWANRGRSITDLDEFLSVMGKYHGGSPSTSKGRSTEDNGPFWANRGRSTEGDGPFWANRGRSTDDNGPFWANRGRSSEADGPFWANRGRSTDNEGPFWANRGRDAFTLSGEDGPFWANRGRREEEDEERLRRDTLYVDEPGWISLIPNHNGALQNNRRSALQDIPQDSDLFWVARGKRVDRQKREMPLYPKQQYNYYSSYRNRRDNNKISRALEQIKAQFWPSRGKK